MIETLQNFDLKKNEKSNNVMTFRNGSPKLHCRLLKSELRPFYPIYSVYSGVAITKKLANHDTSILIDLDDSKHQ